MATPSIDHLNGGIFLFIRKKANVRLGGTRKGKGFVSFFPLVRRFAYKNPMAALNAYHHPAVACASGSISDGNSRAESTVGGRPSLLCERRSVIICRSDTSAPQQDLGGHLNNGHRVPPSTPPNDVVAAESIVSRLRRTGKAIYHYLFLSLILPEDDFATTSRKLGLTLLALLTPLLVYEVPLHLIAWTSVGPNDPGMAWVDVAADVDIVMKFVLLCTPMYIWLRWTKSLPANLFAIVPFFFLLCDTFNAVARSVTFPLHVLSLGYVVIALIGNVPRGYLFVAHAMLNYILYGLNIGRLLNVPGIEAECLARTPFRAFVMPLVCVVATAVILHLLLDQYNNTIAKAQAAATLSQDVANLLKQYDTDQVAEKLREYESNPDADPALVHSFSALVSNLRRYRPFLPNYVLDFDHSRSDDDDDEGEEELTVAQDQRSVTSALPGDNCHSARSVSATPADRHHHHHPHPSADGQGGSASPSGGHSSVAHVAARRRLSGGSLVSAENRPLVAPPAATMGDISNTFTGRVSCSIAQVTWRGGTATSLAKCSALVIALQELSLKTHASLHSLVGDRVFATWNGTRRVARSEVQAARFNLGLRKALAAVDGETGDAQFSWGAIVSGVFRCCMAGDQGLCLFVCSSPEVGQRLNRLTQFATQVAGSVVCDGAANDMLQYDFHTRGVGFTSHPTHPVLNGDVVLSNGWSQWSVVAPSSIAPTASTTTGFSAALFDKGAPLHTAPGMSPAKQQVGSLTPPSLSPRLPTASPRLAVCEPATFIFEIVDERRPGGENQEEWMYVVDAQATAADPNLIVTKAHSAASVGQLSVAAKLLLEAEAAKPDLARTPCVENLSRRIHTALTTTLTSGPP